MVVVDYRLATAVGDGGLLYRRDYTSVPGRWDLHILCKHGNGYRKVFVYMTPRNSAIRYQESAGLRFVRSEADHGRGAARDWGRRFRVDQLTNLYLNATERTLMCSNISRCNARER
jgi:hypothetical protein